MTNIEKRKKIIDMIKELSTYFNNVRDALCAPYGLSSIQAVIILDVYHNPDETKITDICKRLHKSTNTISPLVNRLVSKGFLKKTQSKDDGRVTYVELTEMTNKITEKISIDIYDFTWPMFERLSDDDMDSILNSLSILLEVTSEWSI